MRYGRESQSTSGTPGQAALHLRLTINNLIVLPICQSSDRSNSSRSISRLSIFLRPALAARTNAAIILVRVEDADGAEGWGEITCGEVPGYSDEWTDSAWVTAEKILAPMVVGKEVESAADVWDADEMGPRPSDGKVRRSRPRAGTSKQKNSAFRCGGISAASIRRSSAAFRSVFRTRSSSFSKRSRSSSTPVTNGSRSRSRRTWDYDVIKAVREEFGDILLMGDANSAYTLDDIDQLKSLDEFDLMMLEQPLPYDDIIDHAKLQAQIKTPICLDEPIKSPDDARKAIELRLRQDHQPKKRPRRRPHPVKTRSNKSAAKPASPSGAAACSNPASAAPTTSPSRPSPATPCPATSRPANVIGTKT